jgi:hypothetical protein
MRKLIGVLVICLAAAAALMPVSAAAPGPGARGGHAMTCPCSPAMIGAAGESTADSGLVAMP